MRKKAKKALFLVIFILLGTIGSNVFSASRTVTFTGTDTNYASKDGVTVVEAASSGSYTVSCVNGSSQTYMRFGGTTEYVKFTLDNESERIDSVEYIWRAGTTNHHFLFLFGSSLTLGSYLGSGDAWEGKNGGWAKSTELSASGVTNCPGSVLKFPAESEISSLVMCRRLVINNTSYPENTNMETFYGRMNNTANANYPVAYGSSSTTVIGEVILHISEIVNTPTIELASGSNPANEVATIEMTPVVYNYVNVADEDNVVFAWYTNNTYETTTSAPAGLAITKDTEANTVTVSGTPTTAGTYYYKVSVNETDGNSIEGSVVVSAYVTPTPVIELSSGSSTQHRKAGTAIGSIVYTLTHADGASISGLPDGLSAVYDAGSYTISGTIDALESVGTYNYTVTADPLDGYSGDDVTTTGTIVVKSTTAVDVLYLTAASSPSAQDTKLYPNLLANNDILLTVKAAASSAPAAASYDDFDLIILNESVGSTNAEAIALEAVDKPILSLKSFVYNTGRWEWGTADNGTANNGTVTVKQPNHPIFDGITLTNGSLELLSDAAAKGVQPTDVTITGGINIALAPKSSGTGVAIHDVPASVRGVENSKYLLVALCNDSYDKMTNDALTLLDNAIDYLLNGEQYVAEAIAFRSNASANWGVATSWVSSADNTNWSADVVIPTSANTSSVSIQSAHSITVAADATSSGLVIQPGASLTIDDTKTLAVTGNLALQSDETNGTATLIDNGTLTVSGTSSVQQFLTGAAGTGRAWWYIATPVTGAKTDIFGLQPTGGTNKMGYYQENKEGGPGYVQITNTTTYLEPGVGYNLNTGGADAVYTFTGSLNNGDVTIYPTRTGTTHAKRGFNLIGNPYPSYLNWQTASATATNVRPSIWYRTKSGDEMVFNAYSAATDIGVGAAKRNIPPMQAFWIRVDEDGNDGEINFTNAMRLHDNASGNPLKAPTATDKQIVRLIVSNGMNQDEAVILSMDNAQDGYDYFDSEKMSNSNVNIPEIFTLAGKEELVINALNSIEHGKELTLGFRPGKSGEFSISLTEMENLDMEIVLKDKVAAWEQELRLGESYSFSSDAIATNDRFSILFRTPGSITGMGSINSSLNIFSNEDNRITIQTASVTAQSIANVYNLAGQRIASQQLKGVETVIDAQLASGIYLVTVSDGMNRSTQRVVVK